MGSSVPGPVGFYTAQMSVDIIVRLVQHSYAFEVLMAYYVWLSWQR